ncbi:hypothetical protein [Chryseobacterium sp. Leaf201]|uniref:hypothetical protein n=1 Tax=Chryseobacterium sp. Leaf201 TaxID=1735672 RepID=UPI0006F74371|nr:hypothetical protein [Chryseobacterium sp. Leaf201]
MANFTFLNLDEETRKLMLDEINSDISNGKLYLSNRLNQNGKDNYQNYLLESVENGDEETFTNLLIQSSNFNDTEIVQGKSKKVPSNAASLLCQSEFNRYYIRAICLRAMNQNQDEVKIYRGRESSWTRPESEVLIGTSLNATDLLEDLRNSIGISPQLFPEINSGLTIKI